ncbi:hypothetical protein SS1G_00495 [Sclerotinia sclerotiorum 1980 UF-70]|uniref:Early meiotic induction protein 1 n=2 Tax=Sclerotinia sclerotiorum (strain ATCC 18683 / 1980 / Ss-1) TaxID=665079 RepID=A7E5C0_SCLS1|nr:hypothetical protein SS1G_00495 [Sclerotinia sclerotiorum 1980 UF-70]APA07893.1 hypothetical protein sscle_03g026630 [Sclerotinia sclerotiorum 1980 UF-70]EDN91092.1 hypothetical protein SS1G_00495 [Sclerotinia sclerotiorum 1980 UF-70]
MGWFSSSAEKTASSAAGTPVSSPSSTPTSTPQTKALSRDEIAEQELNSFIRELEAETHPSSTKYNRVPRDPPPEPSHSQSSTQTSPQTPPQNDTSEPLSTQLLPTTMSCRTAFDAAFYCQSLGGQFNNLYRYGTARDCSDTWSDFWFCMKTRTYGDNEKAKLIKARWMEKEKRKYGDPEDKNKELGKSSEDVWKGREQRLEWGEAFCVKEPKWTGSDDEWRKMEKEHREARKTNL